MSSAAAVPIEVCVYTLAGRCLQLQCHPEETVGELKFRIMESWHVRRSNQRLAHATEELMDLLPLKLVASDRPSPLSLTVITTNQPIETARITELTLIVNRLESSDYRRRRAAVDLLAEVVERSDAREVETVVGLLRRLLHHACPGTRRAAAEATGRIAPTGHQEAITTAAHFLEDRDDFVRFAAVDAVIQLSSPGDALTICKMRGLLRHSRSYVRAAALMVVGRVAQLVDVLEVEVAKLADDKDESVREAAYEAFTAALA